MRLLDRAREPGNTENTIGLPRSEGRGKMAANAQAMQDVWARTVDRAKQISISTRLYRALEKAVPVAWEDGVFVVGFHGVDGQMTGVLNTGEHQMTVERALREVSRDASLRLRVIEGHTPADWEHAKLRDAAAQ